MKIWIDFMAPCDVFFFSAILKDLPLWVKENSVIYNTARRHAETESLLKDYGIKSNVVGEHNVNSRISQVSSFIARDLKLSYKVPDFDISLSLANIYAIIVSLMRRRPSISVIDNDLIEYERTLMEKIAAKIHAKATYIIAPEAYPVDLTIEKGADPSRVFTFRGYKEDIYIADYKPDPEFLNKIPFESFVVLRPEALYSTYVHEKQSITPDLLRLFTEHEINVIYLPRYSKDRVYLHSVKNKSRVWIPSKPLNGLDLVYYSKAVLTGSGTFAREAACMGQVAVSFFPDKLLAVDKSLIDQGKMFHSRDPYEIVEYVLKMMDKNIKPSTENSKKVKREFMSILSRILEEVQK